MRLVFALFVMLSVGSAFAQGNPDQPKQAKPAEPQTTGQGYRAGEVPQAPIGHRQPRVIDLPPDVRDAGAKPTPAEEDFDKRLRICRGC
jgi:hypothetical protein